MTRNRDLELYEKVYGFLKTHTYKEAASEFNISEKQISRIKKYMQEQEKINVPEEAIESTIQPSTLQPEPEIIGSGSATGVDSQDRETPKREEKIKETEEPKTKKDRIGEILSTKKPTDQKNRKQGTDYYLKGLILKGFEKSLNDMGANIKISF
jgi:hypothetical protein